MSTTSQRAQTFMERCHSPESKRFHHNLKSGGFISYTATKETDPESWEIFYEKILKPVIEETEAMLEKERSQDKLDTTP